jgi:hypothetical protein
MNEMKVEIGQYRIVDKGPLKGFFSVVIYFACGVSVKLLDCRYFVSGDSRWFSMPTKEIKREGLKTDYIPLVSFLDKSHTEQVKTLILDALKDAKPQEKYGQSQNRAPQRQTNQLPTDASAGWGEPPF